MLELEDSELQRARLDDGAVGLRPPAAAAAAGRRGVDEALTKPLSSPRASPFTKQCC